MSHPPVIRSPLLDGVPGLRHAFFSREGGVSEGIYQSLNVGKGSRDDPEAVSENRRRAAAALGAGHLNTLHQIHSADALHVDAPMPDERPRGDGLVADRSGLLLGALAADCAPVLMADPEARVIAAVHAGWRGALAGVVQAAVARMEERGARPERILAAVGPCIGPDSYEVGAEFRVEFLATDRDHARFFRLGAAEAKFLFDLPAFVLDALARAGVREAHWTGEDTYADDRFFSNRRAVHRREGDYGRQLSAIVLD